MNRLGFCDALYPLVLSGRKTATRRVAKPKFKVGDIVAAAAAWGKDIPGSILAGVLGGIHLRVNDPTAVERGAVRRWNPAYSMPLRAAEAHLRILDIREERLQDITEEECLKEGIERMFVDTHPVYVLPNDMEGFYHSARRAFATLWDSLAKRGKRWADHLVVFPITFEIVKEV